MTLATQDIDEGYLLQWHSSKKEQRTPPRKHKRETKSKLSTKLFVVMLWVAFGSILAWYYDSTTIDIGDHFISTTNSGWEVADKENINAIVIKITDINGNKQLVRFAYRLENGSYLQSDRELSINSLNSLYERLDASTMGAKKL